MADVTCCPSSDSRAGKVPMHPEDFAALLEWVRAKERRTRAQPGDRSAG